MLALLLALSANAADFDTLFDDSGWRQLATPSTDVSGPIDLRLKEIDGKPCLRGEVTVEASVDSLMAVAMDIEGSETFSSEELLATDVLGRNGKSMDYYQVLDVPNWTMAADRYWVLRGTQISTGPTRGFKWTRFDWRSEYPELAEKIDATYQGAIEPQTNWGAWMFTPVEAGTLVRYHLCSTAGGNLPEWLQKAAATKTLPNSMADAIREAKRRDAAK